MKKDPPIREVVVTKESDEKIPAVSVHLHKNITNHIIESPYILKWQCKTVHLTCYRFYILVTVHFTVPNCLFHYIL